MEVGWNTADADKVAACFTADVDYADPLRYHFTSRTELLPFFAVPPGDSQSVLWHALVFDEAEQTGAAEYTYTGNHTYHGLALIRIRDGLVSQWREYQHISEQPWDTFVDGPRDLMNIDDQNRQVGDGHVGDSVHRLHSSS